ncbi:hypothetical protein HY484_00185 [Candidatus Woesearchaeota archaeon]|nr:hypothetical protein [Candidatus Woesearchaeota archaeon]
MKKETEFLKPQEFVRQVFVPTNLTDLLQIFEEERRKIGLSETDISLLLPEDEPFEVGFIGCAGGNQQKGYSVSLCPNAIELDGRYTMRQVIRHELAHIKNGDCDRKLPRVLKWIYTILIEEPRANWYAFR